MPWEVDQNAVKIELDKLNKQINENFEKYKDRGWVFASELLEGTILDPEKDRLFFYDMKGVTNEN